MLLLAIVLGAAVVSDTDRDAGVEIGAAVAFLLLSLGLAAGRFGPIAFALLVLGAIYTIPDGERAVPAPVYGAAMLLTGELAHLSIEDRLGRFAAGVGPRLAAIVAVAAASIPASALVLLAAEPDVARSPGLTAAGAVAAVACLALLAALARVRSAPEPDEKAPPAAGPSRLA